MCRYCSKPRQKFIDLSGKDTYIAGDTYRCNTLIVKNTSGKFSLMHLGYLVAYIKFCPFCGRKLKDK